MPNNHQINEIIQETNEFLSYVVDAIKHSISSLNDQKVDGYDEKNAHISKEISEIGNELLMREEYSLSEKFWMNITEITDVANKSRRYKINRGISLANTGVSQIIQTKVKEGLFNLFRALNDDKDILEKLGMPSNPEDNLVSTKLFSQFEDGLIENVRNKILLPNAELDDIVLTLDDLRAFFKKQDADKHLFLFLILNQLFSALRRNKILPNILSRQDILRSISDLCLFLEDSLRRKNPSVSSIYAGFSKPFGLSSFPGDALSGNLNVLVEKIELQERDVTQSKENKRIKIAHLLRNYVSHNLETSNHDFFSSEQKILKYISNIFYTIVLADKHHLI